MAKFALRNEGRVDYAALGRLDPHMGCYLAVYDPEANDGMGHIVWTPNPDDALLFDDMIDAMKCWKQVPENHPLRDDGKPNRPLTAYSVMPVKMRDE